LDIPVVNLLFSNYTKSYFNRKILILVTPRKPIIDENDVLAVQKELEQEKDKNLILKKYSFYKRAEQFYSQLALSNPNLDSALKSIDQMQLFKTFDKDELDYEVRFRKSTVQRMIRDLADLLIH
jgi:type II secretory pathway component GspD/PulD (secretin)